MVLTLSKPDTTLKCNAKHRGWTNEKAANLPLPMKSDSTYQAILQLAKGPKSIKDQHVLEESMGFSYQQGFRELILTLSYYALAILGKTSKRTLLSCESGLCHTIFY